MAEHEHARSQASYESAALPLSYWPVNATTTQSNNADDTAPETAGGGDVGQALLAHVRRVLAYDPETGELTWKVARRKCRVGDRAGSLTHEGYVATGMNGRAQMAHRVAWMIMTGELPPARIDHINGDRADNRWCNLRRASDHENAWNSLRSANATGVWRRYGRIHGRIRHLGKVYTAGPFQTEAECTAWYRAKERELRGAWSASSRARQEAA